MTPPHDPRWSWVAVALSLAAAIACWPASPARSRLVALLAPARGPGGRLGHLAGWIAVDPHRGVVVLVVSALGGGLLAGVGGALAAAIASGVGYHRWRAGAVRRGHSTEVAALLDAVAVMTAELRAGAHPAGAAASAAAGAGVVHRVLTSVAAGAQLGAQVPALLERHASNEPAIADELRRMAAAWALAERHGATLAELMDAVRADLEARVRLAGQIKAQLAGPRASSAVLAGLPVLGVALGQGIGANPWQVLTGTPVGQVLLVVGTGLVCAGMLWSGRITGKAVPQ
ncbi:MAG TPA: type II secretion system F family protein [Pseudonocardia sp.]|uniref:type II secretion system F family protein n=1 Tax=Pseudonocardia sp. TaxID=60912 RepID=UPI002B7298E0|nr:type II secretion system F family protein [Pseudonocardia sp.]HTF48784.1 type II secretion system F family protein [Pseudonocardia sp.]